MEFKLARTRCGSVKIYDQATFGMSLPPSFQSHNVYFIFFLVRAGQYLSVFVYRLNSAISIGTVARGMYTCVQYVEIAQGCSVRDARRRVAAAARRTRRRPHRNRSHAVRENITESIQYSQKISYTYQK